VSATDLGKIEHVPVDCTGEDMHAIESVHDVRYLIALHKDEPQEFWSSCLSTASVLHATREAIAAPGHRVFGTLASGLHHARKDYESGFCRLNGLAIAAREAADAGKKVLILDLDAHGGGGTVSLIADQPNIDHIDLVTCPFDDDYVSTPFLGGYGRTTKYYVDADNYLPTLTYALAQASTKVYDVVIYNAGMDPIDEWGMTKRILGAREHAVFAWAWQHDVPVVFTMAGGYNEIKELVGLHLLTFKAAAVWEGQAALVNRDNRAGINRKSRAEQRREEKVEAARSAAAAAEAGVWPETWAEFEKGYEWRSL
jgi:acetoin utilization deacetylase AcuC-like enzyme